MKKDIQIGGSSSTRGGEEEEEEGDSTWYPLLELSTQPFQRTITLER